MHEGVYLTRFTVLILCVGGAVFVDAVVGEVHEDVADAAAVIAVLVGCKPARYKWFLNFKMISCANVQKRKYSI